MAWWPLDENASDLSGNGFDGITQGLISFGETGANEVTGGAGLFDGSSHIDVPWNPQLNTNDFSVTLWVNPAAAGGSHRSPITNRDDVSPEAPSGTAGSSITTQTASGHSGTEVAEAVMAPGTA